MAKRSTTPQLVTRESLNEMLEQADNDKRKRIVGRALVVLFRLQTESERAGNVTDRSNSVGFSSSDARQGSISAKYFISHGTLLDFQLEMWMRLQHGYPKICKYARQLNQAAVERAMREGTIS